MSATQIQIAGLGAVSPAGWGASALIDSIDRGVPLPAESLSRPGVEKPFSVRRVPPSPSQLNIARKLDGVLALASPARTPPGEGRGEGAVPGMALRSLFAHPRLRRTSPISKYALGAAVEAVGDDAKQIAAGEIRLGIVTTVMAGCVNYCSRFYAETLQDASKASPLVFPETVFNAPASHLAAYFGTTSRNYTLVGDDANFLQAMAIAAQWLVAGQVDACLVIGAEEMDWLVAAALELFSPDSIHSEGAGALYLKATAGSKTEGSTSLHSPVSTLHFNKAACLERITGAHSYCHSQRAPDAAKKMRAEFPAESPEELLCTSVQGISRADRAEREAWKDWTGSVASPKNILGQAFMASTAWQCVYACAQIRSQKFRAASICSVGDNQQAIGARFIACDQLHSSPSSHTTNRHGTA